MHTADIRLSFGKINYVISILRRTQVFSVLYWSELSIYFDRYELSATCHFIFHGDVNNMSTDVTKIHLIQKSKG